MTDPLDKYKDVDLEQLIYDDLLKEIREDLNERLYKVIENYNKQNKVQRFFQKIKWGFDVCHNNFRNWQGHMKGEGWDFWEILSGEEEQ